MLLRICLLIAVCCTAARADDGSITLGQGGSASRIAGDHATVRMVRQWVRMDLHAQHYDVTATFLFHNDGPATHVLMGFPERAFGDEMSPDEFRARTDFLRFATTVDGQPVTARRQASTDKAFVAYWTKRVPFARGQWRTVQVTYRARPTREVGGWRWVGYDFTGGNWRGRLRDAHLLVVLHAPGIYLCDPSLPMRQQGNRFSFSWSDWGAELPFRFRLISTMPQPLEFPERLRAFPEGPVGALRWVTVPGPAPDPVWLPPAVEQDGTVMVQLQALKSLLRERARQGVPTANLEVGWDAATREALVQVGETTLRFRPGRAEMGVDRAAAVPLPAAPFRPGRVTRVIAGPEYAPSLYVPLRPLVEALGGSVTVDLKGRRVDPRIPAP